MVLFLCACDAQYQLLLCAPYCVLGNMVRLMAGATWASSTSVANSRTEGSRQVCPPRVKPLQ